MRTMTDTQHERLERAGLLEGSLDRQTRAAWPSWAQGHFARCPRCQALAVAERLLAGTLRHAVARRYLFASRPPPSMEALQARLQRRQAPPPAALVDGSRPMPARQFRSQSPLDLVRTDWGVRAWHGDATQLLLLAAPQARHPVVLRERREDKPGVGLDAAYEVTRETVFLAVAARERLVPLHWESWLDDALSSASLESLLDEHQSQAVHLAALRVRPPIRASRLNIQEAELPDAKPPVKALLQRAAQAGRADDAAAAARLYRQASELAAANDDTGGRVRAACGLSLALSGLGYLAEAERVLQTLVAGQSLDATWGCWICRHLAQDAFYLLDLEAARAWLADAVALEQPPGPWVCMNLGLYAATTGSWAEALRQLDAVDDSALPPTSVAAAACYRSLALLGAGRPDEARRIFDEIVPPEKTVLELELYYALVRVAMAQAADSALDWEALLRLLAGQLAEKDDEVLATWDAPPLMMLVERARRAGQHSAAKRLFRLRFLDSRRAADSQVQLLALAASHDGLLLHSPGQSGSLRRLALTRAEFSRLVGRARDELRGGSGQEACRMLGAMLFKDGHVPRGEFLVGSDGLLADAPIQAIALASRDRDAPAPVARDLVGLRQSPCREGEQPLATIASLADANGDLPSAASEVRREEAALWLRGSQVRRERLQLERPVGLLHLGLHARRSLGVTQLLLADGPMSPVELAQLCLPGSPVVLLAGCDTGAHRAHGSLERSLADAFLRAGAAGVIATRWPVEDRELFVFVRAVVVAWPFSDLAGTVARTCLHLKRQGYPARLWAAPVVY